MLFACVKVGTRYSDDYVLKLKRGVERHLSSDHGFVCFTDKPIAGVDCEPAIDGLPGWWAKLTLFSLCRPLCYFDLDTVIVGDLARFVEWDGFGTLKDPWLPGYGSGVMKLTGNEYHVWEKFRPGIMTMMRGDQDWLNIVMPGARTFPPEWFPNFKALDSVEKPPGAMAVNFNGFPKPRQITSGWVPEHWR